MDGEQNKSAEPEEPAKLPVSHPWYIALFLNELRTVLKAPISFTIIAALCLALGWYVTSYEYEKFIIPNLNGQIQDWQASANGAGISNDEWKPLTDEQAAEFISKLSTFRIHSMFINLSGNNTERLGESLYNVFDKLNCQYPVVDTDFSPRGLTLQVSKDDPVTPAIIDLVRKYDSKVVIKDWEHKYNPDEGSFIYLWIGKDKDN